MKWILVLNNLFFRSPLPILGFCWKEDQNQELMEKNRAKATENLSLCPFATLPHSPEFTFLNYTAFPPQPCP